MALTNQPYYASWYAGSNLTADAMTVGRLSTKNNTLDDGNGTSTFTYGTSTKNGVGIGASADLSGLNFGLCIAAPAGSTVWPLGVFTGGGSAKRMLVITAPNYSGSANGQLLSLNNTLDDGAGNMIFNGTNPTINFKQSGIGPPSFTTRSIGTKLVLWESVGPSAGDFALGVDNQTLWSSVQLPSYQFKWYGGTTLAMTLSGTGNLTLPGNLTIQGATGSAAAGQVLFGNTTATTATAGTSGAPPAQVAGYMVVNIGGTNYKLPYYNN